MEKKKKKKVKLTDEMLHASALRLMELEAKQIDEEMKNAEPHVFSAEFERKMQELMRVATPAELAAKRRKKRMQRIQVAAAVSTMALVVVGLIIGKNQSSIIASEPGVRITTWCKEFFSFGGEKEDGITSVVFDESQIGYIPDGFNKTEEDKILTMTVFKYENEHGHYIYINSCTNNDSTYISSEDIMQDVRLSDSGIEFHYIENRKSNELKIIFQGNDKQYYSITGTISKDEILKVMEGIKH